MDINCTFPCTHQSEGKCHLEEIDSALETTINPLHSECPYYKEKKSFPSLKVK